MKRRSFFASLAAIIAAPFAVKAKADPKLELEAWIKANPELYTLIICKSIEQKMKATGATNPKPNQSVKLKGYDIFI
jgi:hypothetical protein